MFVARKGFTVNYYFITNPAAEFFDTIQHFWGAVAVTGRRVYVIEFTFG
jgi:hypothetical protein